MGSEETLCVITTAHPWEVSCGALLPNSILLGLQDFVQTACYSVHHKGLLLLRLIIYYLVYQTNRLHQQMVNLRAYTFVNKV
jgi:hypothetical protein